MFYSQLMIVWFWNKSALNEIVSISFNEDLSSYVLTSFSIETNIRDVSLVTNFSYCNVGDILYVYSGYIYPSYQSNQLISPSTTLHQ